MLTMDERNQLFLAGNPDIRRKIRAAYRKAHPPVIVMAIKPKFAKAIYEGRKNWEFRKAPPCASVTGNWPVVWEMVKTNKCFTRNLPGINEEELDDYAGRHDVTALRVFKAERLEHEVTFGAKPPQNWGRFAATYRETPKKEGDSHD